MIVFLLLLAVGLA